jgi:hypothetical protein
LAIREVGGFVCWVYSLFFFWIMVHCMSNSVWGDVIK